MRGRAIRLSVPRRIVMDVLRWAVTIPTIPGERLMDLSTAIAARNACLPRPPWAAILAKAFAIVAQEIPELRRAFLKWPWPHLYEYPTSVAVMTIDRIYERAPCVLFRLIKDPAAYRIPELTEVIRQAKRSPLNEVKDFKRALTIARLPAILRRPLWWLGFNIGRQRGNYFGTFVVTVMGATGNDALHLLGPATTTVSLGVFRPDGRVKGRIVFDHRVFDGIVAARLLSRLESVLNGPIAEELRSMATKREPAIAAAASTPPLRSASGN